MNPTFLVAIGLAVFTPRLARTVAAEPSVLPYTGEDLARLAKVSKAAQHLNGNINVSAGENLLTSVSL